MKKVLIPLFALALIGAVVVAETGSRKGFGPGRGFGPGCEMGGSGMGPGHHAMLVRHLDLTDAQKTQLDQLRGETHATIEPLFDKMHELHGKLEEMLDADTADATQLGQQMVAIRAVKKQLDAAWVDHDTKLIAILTPDQQNKLEELEAERGARRHHGFGGHGPFGHAPMDGGDQS